MLVGDEAETLRGLMPQGAAWSVVEHAERPTGDPARVVRRIEWDAAWPALLGPASLAVLGIGVLGAAGATARLEGSAGSLAALVLGACLLAYPFVRGRDAVSAQRRAAERGHV